MSGRYNRGRINCAPIRRGHGLLMGMPATLEPLAMTYQTYPAVPDGVLVRVSRSGLLCRWIGGALQSVDQRKAQTALARMAMSKDKAEESSAAELAALLRKWRGDMPASRAAQLLGMSKRTYEGIEQGREFRYSRLLILAIKAFE